MEDVGDAAVWDVVPGGDNVTPSTESINQSTGSKTQTSSVCRLTHFSLEIYQTHPSTETSVPSLLIKTLQSPC